MTTPIQSLAHKALCLWDAIDKADHELLSLYGNELSLKSDGKHRIETLQRFFDEASDRAHRIEDYIVTLRPTCQRDAIVLLSIATAMASSPPLGDRKQQQERVLSRLLFEVLNFLEQDSATTAKALAGNSFGVCGTSWEEEFTRIAESLSAPRQEDKTNEIETQERSLAAA